MTEGGIYQAPRPRTASIAIVVLMHGAGLTALALSKMDMTFVKHPPTEVFWVDPPKPPPEPEARAVEAKQPIKAIYVQPHVVIPDFIENPPIGEITPSNLGSLAGDGGDSFVEVTPPLPPEPVRKDARIDSRSALQPPYPASEQRAGAEGVVSLRVLIGPDGRVKAAEKVKATSDAFYQETLRHALRNWRFTPATIDGRPVESRKLMTVRFELNS